MLEADQIVDLLTTAGTLALVACPVMGVALAATARIAWGQAKDRHRAEAHADSLTRRLADVEALRKRDQWKRGEMELPGVTSREQAERLAHRNLDASFGVESVCAGCGTTGWGSDHAEDCPNNPTADFDPDEKSDLPVTVSTPKPSRTFVAVDPAGKDHSVAVSGTRNEDGSITITGVSHEFTVAGDDLAAINRAMAEPIPPAMPDAGRDGTDVRDLPPPMIREHLGDPPFIDLPGIGTAPDPSWHDEYGRECG